MFITRFPMYQQLPTSYCSHHQERGYRSSIILYSYMVTQLLGFIAWKLLNLWAFLPYPEVVRFPSIVTQKSMIPWKLTIFNVQVTIPRYWPKGRNAGLISRWQYLEKSTSELHYQEVEKYPGNNALEIVQLLGIVTQILLQQNTSFVNISVKIIFCFVWVWL